VIEFLACEACCCHVWAQPEVSRLKLRRLTAHGRNSKRRSALLNLRIHKWGYMKTSILKGAAFAAGLFLASQSAQALVVLDDGISAPYTGQYRPTNTSVSTTFNATAGASALSFDLIGGLSLDGVNCCTDTFTLSLNGTDIFSGSFDLGGTGADTIFSNPLGFLTAGGSNGFFQGGLLTVSGIVNLLAGSNTLTFSYASNFPQGTADESWGVNDVNVANAVSAVPLPPAVLLLGSGLLGLVGWRRKRA
jgi:hypothetical protein